ncbi:hypothetical protein LIER_29523 [Lithospermum erythrorhizon]|uniref:non-specific serine/threonine protein kinase n=1 Tax=Lithospermum erythrorhizon TaxID=34254 RepID=A0AAV3RPM3_LITER
MHFRDMESYGTSEITETWKELNSGLNRQNQRMKPSSKYNIGDDINKLFEAINIRSFNNGVTKSEQGAKDALKNSSMKRPMRIGFSRAVGIGISQPVSLKQALRGLCISQASEMAAMKRKMHKPSSLSDEGSVMRLYKTVVAETGETNKTGLPINLGRGNLMEVSLVPERSTLKIPDNSAICNHHSHVNQSDHNTELPTSSEEFIEKPKISKALPIKETVSSSANFYCKVPEEASKHSDKLKMQSSNRKLQVLFETIPSMDQVPAELENQENCKSLTASLSSSLDAGSKTSKPISSTLSLIKPVSRIKSLHKKKLLSNSPSIFGPRKQREGVDNHLSCNLGDAVCQKPNSVVVKKASRQETEAFSSCSTSMEVSSKISSSTGMEVSSTLVDSSSSIASVSSLCCDLTRSTVEKYEEGSRSRQQRDISESSKMRNWGNGSTTSCYEESQHSGSSRNGSRPHMSTDVRWQSINSVKKEHGNLGFRHFKLLRKLGSGDIGTVYLSELVGSNCLFAVKVLDNDFLESRRKMARAQMEKEILEILDHPFLPTLYAHFTTDRFSCLVMEYCSGGDLHVLRQRQHTRSFNEQATRFYVAEVLLALEYLHMLGVVYRDLKPENILVREDGHIMLTDFDLSFRCAVNPTLLKSPFLSVDPPKKTSPCSHSSCIDPFCLNPSWQVSCFTPRFLPAVSKSHKIRCDIAAQVNPFPQLVVEPTSARSNSFVGTHEYLAPEVVKGEGHGSAVDWWTLGIFLYELLYGKTPFKGLSNDDTLANVVSVCLKFPESPMVSSHARDLIRKLLQKEPDNRLGSQMGAAEIKQHPFFEGLNFALIRCATPPELPELVDPWNLLPVTSSAPKKERGSTGHKDLKTAEDDIVFEMF